MVFLISVNLVSATPKKVLIEYVTGTWCGNCPCGHQTLSTIKAMYPQTIIIAYHAFSNDPWRNFNGNEIVNLMQFSATPSANIDRNAPLNNSNYTSWISSVQNRYTSVPDSRVDLNVVSKTYNEATRELSMTINTTALEDLDGQYKVTFVIAEDNLIYQQNFYAKCGTPGIVHNYEHDNVARTIINGAAGENLNSGNIWNVNQTISKTVSVTIDAGWNVSNCKVIVFVNKAEASFPLSMVEQGLELSVEGTVGINGNTGQVPVTYFLSQNYPNPFNPTTNVEFGIPVSGFASLKVFDLLGNEVAVLLNEKIPAGNHSVSFNGTDLSSGIYFYKLETGSFVETKKMFLIK